MNDTTTIATERVAAGAAYLDEVEPGWVDKIDLNRLNLASGCQCVLGQLAIDHELEFASYADCPEFSDWIHGYLRDVEPIGTMKAIECGFTRRGPDPVTFMDLERAWRDLIVMRRALATAGAS